MPTATTPTITPHSGPSRTPVSSLPSGTPTATEPSLSPTCEYRVCFVGSHDPDDSFNGWYFRSEEEFGNRPIWKFIDDERITIQYAETWVNKSLHQLELHISKFNLSKLVCMSKYMSSQTNTFCVEVRFVRRKSKKSVKSCAIWFYPKSVGREYEVKKSSYHGIIED